MFRSTNEDIQQLVGAQSAIARLSEQERALRTEHRAAEQELRAIKMARPPAEQIVKQMRAIVDAVAAKYSAENAYGVIEAFAGGVTAATSTSGRDRPRPPALWRGRPEMRFGELTTVDVCGLLPEVVKSSFERMIRAHATADGLTTEQKAAAVAKAEARIQCVEEEHSNLVDAAAGLNPPIVMELLPVVKQRRASEARSRELEEQRVARRAEREAALDAAAAQPPAGGTFSQYLAENSPERDRAAMARATRQAAEG